MITFVKQSKLIKTNPALFKFVGASASDINDEQRKVGRLEILLPPADLFTKKVERNISGKKFEKKYIKYLSEEHSMVENAIYYIAKILNNNENVCFVCTDEEYKVGYIEILANYIGNLFGVEVKKFKDIQETIDEAMEELEFSKKQKKFVNDFENASEEKFMKLSKKIAKTMNEDGFSSEGSDYFDSLKAMYAVDDCVCKLINDKAITINKSLAITNIDESLIKSKKIINAIETAASSNKKLGKIITKLAESHDLKLKKLKKLETASLIGFVNEVYNAFGILRSGDAE